MIQNTVYSDSIIVMCIFLFHYIALNNLVNTCCDRELSLYRAK